MKIVKLSLSMAALLVAATAFAEIKPADIFADGAVLQQGEPVRIWGTAEPGEKVTVEFAQQRKTTSADAAGNWMVTLDPMKASAESRPMQVSSPTTSNQQSITLHNVVVGEVWLAGGQSNMASTMYTYRRTVQADIDSADDPLLRMVTIPRLEYAGQNDLQPEWKETTSQNVKGFSATAYYFAKNLRETLKVPVGIVSCSVGATPAEAWMSRETLSSTPDMKRILDAYDREVQKYATDFENYIRLKDDRARRLKEWQKIRRSGVKPIPTYPAEVMGPHNYKRPCGLHENMLTQTIPYTLRGVIWYQGESNTRPAFHYRTVFPALINEWRTEFMNSDLPFLFVQIATFGPAHEKSTEWPELREAQQWTEDHVENTGMVVLADGGEIDDIHPHSKPKAGLRLSLLARHMVYGEKELVCRGPRPEKATSKNSRIELTFKHIGSGLVLKSAETTPFEICGEDGSYVPAKAKLVDGKIIVSAEGVTAPKQVRYGWKKWFEPTLFNVEGLPASPFRTDDFEPATKDRYYLDHLK